MKRYLACECGFELLSTDLAELIEGGRQHARRVHRMRLSAEQVAALVRPVGSTRRDGSSSDEHGEGGQGWPR